MSVEGFLDAGNLLSAGDTTRRWSEGVWQSFPVNRIRAGLVSGWVREFDFCQLKPSTNVNAAEAYWDQGYMVFGSDGAPITRVNGVGLAGGATFGSDGDNEGIGIRDAMAPFRLSRADYDFAIEIELETSTIADTKHGFFWGLMDNTAATATSPIAAAGTLADVNFVGLHRLEGDGDKLDFVYKCDGVTQVSQMTDAITLVAATRIKLGMRYRTGPDAINGLSNLLRIYANGKPIADTSTSVGGLGYKQIPVAAGDFPMDVAMGFTFNLLNATASTPGTTTLGRVRYGQAYEAF